MPLEYCHLSVPSADISLAHDSNASTVKYARPRLFAAFLIFGLLNNGQTPQLARNVCIS